MRKGFMEISEIKNNFSNLTIKMEAQIEEMTNDHDQIREDFERMQEEHNQMVQDQHEFGDGIRWENVNSEPHIVP